MGAIKIGQESFKGKTMPIYLLVGVATRDAEDKTKDTPHACVSLAVGDDKEGNPAYVKLDGWRDLAPVVGKIKKLDSILAVAVMRESEYEGKSYTNWDARFVAKSGAGLNYDFDDPYDATSAPPEIAPPSVFEDVNDEDLPF